MNEACLAHELSAAAAARRDAMLPGLLLAVRRRRHRRRLLQASAALLLVALGAWALVPAPRPAPPAAVSAWTVVHDDPNVLARCAVANRTRPEWFVDDAGLAALLAASGRPAGLVRCGGRVCVSAAAVDPWPGEP
jgi:hypothetical protein